MVVSVKYLRHRLLLGYSRAEVRRSFITTAVREESQVTPQGRHRQGSNHRLYLSRESVETPPNVTWARRPKQGT